MDSGSMTISRRAHVERQTEAERAIRDAMEKVEAMGAHPFLTDAVIALGRAFSRCADFTDGCTVATERDLPGLSFRTLRTANVARLPLFKNNRGEPAHSQPDGGDWRASGWSNATMGEVGEFMVEVGKLLMLANTVKKLERGDLGTLEEALELIKKEVADPLIYLDIFCYRLGIDLGEAVRLKWNATSQKLGIPLRITEENHVQC